jgi:hypothetical protein
MICMRGGEYGSVVVWYICGMWPHVNYAFSVSPIIVCRRVTAREEPPPSTLVSEPGSGPGRVREGAVVVS